MNNSSIFIDYYLQVKSVTFAASGNYFVTVGNRHVKFWYLEHAKLIAVSVSFKNCYSSCSY